MHFSNQTMKMVVITIPEATDARTRVLTTLFFLGLLGLLTLHCITFNWDAPHNAGLPVNDSAWYLGMAFLSEATWYLGMTMRRDGVGLNVCGCDAGRCGLKHCYLKFRRVWGGCMLRSWIDYTLPRNILQTHPKPIYLVVLSCIIKNTKLIYFYRRFLI